MSPLNFANLLKGVRVLDFTAVLAGPHLARALAQAGADVIKVEAIPAGDTTRALPYFYLDGQSGYFTQQNIGKRSIALDLASPEGHEIVMKLAAQSSIVIENFRPGVVNNLKVDYDSVRKVRADIVYLSISGWGQTGPWNRMTGEVRSTTSLSGLIAPDMENNVPNTERCSFGDTNASIHALAAIGAALFRAARTGQGANIDVSILEGLMTTNVLELPEVLQTPTGGLTGREHRTNGDHARVASGNFRCSDDAWLYLRALPDVAWSGLVDVIGLDPVWKGMSQFDRRAIAGEVYDRVNAFCRSHTRDDAIRKLMAAGVSAVPVRSVREVIAEADPDAGGLIRNVPEVLGGTIPVPTGLFASAEFGAAPQRRQPLVGEHTREILHDALGYSEEQIERLLSARVAMETRLPDGSA